MRDADRGKLTGAAWPEGRVVVLALTLAWGASAGVRAGSLDQELLRHAPAVLVDLRAHGVANVGVLKFRVVRDDGAGVGILGLDLSNRLELALLLACEPGSPLGVIHDASASAAAAPGADHHTLSGRRALFAAEYPLAWGDRRVRPDAFLSGTAVVSRDSRSVSVSITALGRGEAAPHPVAEFTAGTDAPLLSGLGANFLVRGVFDDGRVEVADGPPSPAPSRLPTARESSAGRNPLEDPDAPVVLDALYDGRVVPLEFRDDRAWLPEPTQGQRVEFALRTVRPTPERFGVVLMVNGYNTLGKERYAPRQCRKWILGPQTPKVLIRGYQLDDSKAESFRVLSQVESRRSERTYGPDAGTVQLVVFREARKAPEPLALDDDAEDLLAMARGMPSGVRPVTLAALKFQLRSGSQARGLIEGGSAIGVTVRSVPFVDDPTPVMSAFITYYHRN